MAAFEIISKGTTIDTLTGYLRIDQRNDGGLIYCTEFEIDEDGNEIEVGERRLTIHELELEKRQVDGRNHSFVYQD